MTENTTQAAQALVRRVLSWKMGNPYVIAESAESVVEALENEGYLRPVLGEQWSYFYKYTDDYNLPGSGDIESFSTRAEAEEDLRKWAHINRLQVEDYVLVRRQVTTWEVVE